MPNTVHADVSAASLVSIEMLRYGTTYTLNIFLHWVAASSAPDVLPVHRQKLLFTASRGVLSQFLWQDGKTTQVGAHIPAFHRRTGDPLLIAPALHEAVACHYGRSLLCRLSQDPLSCTQTGNTLREN